MYVFDDHRPLQRYTVGVAWALWQLFAKRPDVIFTHMSYGLMACIWFYKYIFRFGSLVVVADCHNKALKRTLQIPWRNRLFIWAKRICLGAVDLAIVTNSKLIEIAESFVPRVAVLRDPLAEWDKVGDQNCPDAPYVFFICSFDRDEPTLVLFGAARRIVDVLGLQVRISGRVHNDSLPKSVREHPGVVFTGFLARDDYVRTLQYAAVVVVLTLDDDCLVCGGYEAIGAGRPTVLSRTSALESCFGEAAVFANNDVDSICEAVAHALEAGPPSVESIEALNVGFESEWRQLGLVLFDELGVAKFQVHAGC